jgi:hypothetical protein
MQRRITNGRDRSDPATAVKLPRWDCRNQAERDYFEEWTLQQLSARNDLRSRSELVMAVADYFKQDIHQPTIAAVKRNDVEWLMKLAVDDPERFRSALTKHSVGRAKGDSRRADLPGLVRVRLAGASVYMDEMNDIWYEHFGHRRRAMAPKALDIAARHWEVDLITLENYRTSHHRRYK